MMALASRSRTTALAGKVVALFDISKPRGTDFLDRVEELLREDYRVKEVIRARKRAFTKPAPPELLEDLGARADFVVFGVADCGSCNTCVEYDPSAPGNGRGLVTCGLSNCIDEALFFSGRRIPTAVVGTVDYQRATRTQESLLGLAQYPLVTVRESIQRLMKEEVRKTADEVMDAVVRQLTMSQ